MSSNPIGIHVGARIKLRRTLLGLSQEKLGDALGLTFQQVQKYEKGTNRVSASKLYRLAQILDVPISFFFDSMPGAGADVPCDPAVDSPNDDPFYRRETVTLVRAYYGIPDPAVRDRLLSLVKSLSRDDPEGDDGAA